MFRQECGSGAKGDPFSTMCPYFSLDCFTEIPRPPAAVLWCGGTREEHQPFLPLCMGSSHQAPYAGCSGFMVLGSEGLLTWTLGLYSMCWVLLGFYA